MVFPNLNATLRQFRMASDVVSPADPTNVFAQARDIRNGQISCIVVCLSNSAISTNNRFI